MTFDTNTNLTDVLHLFDNISQIKQCFLQLTVRKKEEEKPTISKITSTVNFLQILPFLFNWKWKACDIYI